MKRVLIISVEPPWPAHHGGRIRTARVAEALSHRHDVLVAYPGHGEAAASPPVPVRPLKWSAPSSARTRLSTRPHLGGYFLAPIAQQLSSLAAEFAPDTVIWSHSYLAAWSPPALKSIPHIVEFANIEGKRLRSLVKTGSRQQKAARIAEAAKATRWEPSVARTAALSIALSEPDMRVLQAWGANTLLVPNGVEAMSYEPSPVGGYALALASYDYEPNVAAVKNLVRNIWPRVTGQVPGARLVIAGRRSEALAAELEAVQGVSVAGTLGDVSGIYAGSAVAVAAATTGGGSQLKLTEAFARGRSVVMSSFAAEGIPPALRDTGCYQVASDAVAFANALAASLADHKARHSRELAAVSACSLITWDRVVGSLSEAIENGSVKR